MRTSTMRRTARAFAFGAVAGYTADAVFGDPRRGHPVAGFGRFASALERRLYRDHRGAGAAFTAVAVGGVAAAAVVAQHVTRRSPAAQATLAAAATWTVLGGASLTREARVIAGALERGDVEAARERLPHLCGRDPSALDAQQLARAVVESVAENTADAVVNALTWGALAGTPGLLAFRAVNTLDAMVGHRSPRLIRFGWASARLDDVAGWPGARLTALLTVAASEDRGRTWRVWRRDAASHPSPNAGHAEAAFAGALGVRLGGTLQYGARTEHRPVLGAELRPIAVADVERACRLSRRVGSLALATTVAVALLRGTGSMGAAK